MKRVEESESDTYLYQEYKGYVKLFCYWVKEDVLIFSHLSSWARKTLLCDVLKPVS